MQTFGVFVGALFGSALISGIISALSCSVIFGHRMGDSSSNWSIYPLIVAFYWFISLVGALSIIFPLFRLIFDLHSAATYAAIVAGVISIAVAIFTQSQNPDLHAYSR